jgi:RimJ/RimL family protein N-acetyltransferase
MSSFYRAVTEPSAGRRTPGVVRGACDTGRMQGTTVRPVRADEWRSVRALRLRMVADPAAAVAFADSLEHTTAQPDAFWTERTAGGSVDAGDGATVRQFVAEDGTGRWVGSATGLLERAGDADYEGRRVDTDGCVVVGVWVDPDHRGAGVLGALVDAVRDWSTERGHPGLRLYVHAENARAVRAYEKVGFHATGPVFSGDLGPTREMRV